MPAQVRADFGWRGEHYLPVYNCGRKICARQKRAALLDCSTAGCVCCVFGAIGEMTICGDKNSGPAVMGGVNSRVVSGHAVYLC